MQHDYDATAHLPDNDATRLYLQGRELVMREFYDKGAEKLRASLALDNEQAHAHSALSMALLMLNRLDEAGREAGLALQLEPQNSAYLSASALLAQERKDWKRAEILMKRAIAVEPYNPDWLTMLAEVLAAQRRFKDAEVATRQALELSPNDSTAHLLLGQILERETLGWEFFDAARRKQRRREAKWHREQMLKLRPENGRAHFVAGREQRGTASPEQALEHLRESLRLDPNDKQAQKALATAQTNYDSYMQYKWFWDMGFGRLPRGTRIPIGIALIVGFLELGKQFPDSPMLSKLFEYLGGGVFMYMIGMLWFHMMWPKHKQPPER